jgi:methylphosphotriester-DNA--protein-cysteine methyltransferase
VGADGAPFTSKTPGSLGGHRKSKIYGRLDCRTALRAISRGGYVRHRVFFLDEATAVSAGYRPCAVCMPERYARWKTAKKNGTAVRPRRGR